MKSLLTQESLLSWDVKVVVQWLQQLFVIQWSILENRIQSFSFTDVTLLSSSLNLVLQRLDVSFAIWKQIDSLNLTHNDEGRVSESERQSKSQSFEMGRDGVMLNNHESLLLLEED